VFEAEQEYTETNFGSSPGALFATTLRIDEHKQRYYVRQSRYLQTQTMCLQRYYVWQSRYLQTQMMCLQI